MRERCKDFTLQLTSDDRIGIQRCKNRIRGSRTGVSSFVIRLEYKLDGHWRIIHLFDTCHSTIHGHTYGLKKGRMFRTELGEANISSMGARLRELQEDITKHYNRIKQAYLRN